MSSTPVRAAPRGHHTDPLAETPGTLVKKKKKTVAGASTPVRKTTKKKSTADLATPVAGSQPLASDTPTRTSLDRPMPKTPKTKSAISGGGETTAKKPKRLGTGATPASKSALTTGTVKQQQPRLKLASTAAARVSREDSPLTTAHPSAAQLPPAATTSAALATTTTAPARHTSSPSPGRSVTSPGATSTLSTSTVGVGRRFQPSAYKRVFALTGSYTCLECVPHTASLWLADGETGAIEIYNSLTGHLTTTIPAPGNGTHGDDGGSAVTPTRSAMTANASASHRSDRLSMSMTSQRSTMTVVGATVSGPLTAIGATPTAMRATATHMFVGYSNGSVAVYDVLLLQFVTEGRFHTGRVVDLCVLKNGTVVSASDDGALVHWDGEASNFEATTRVLAAEGTSEGRMTCVAAATPPSSTQRGNHVILCGFASGAMLIIDVVTGRELQALHGHTKCLLDIAVLGELIFTTAEDGAVLVWSNRVPEMLAPSTAFAAAGSPGSQRCKLLRRIPVQPTVTAFLIDHHSGSLWVAFADGLLERWSAQPDDDFGVEEVVREGMVRREAGTALCHRPTRLVSMGSADTLQVLALSSNGVNKVWYGHHNTLEEHLSASIHALDRVIEQDAEDTAAWRERLNLLKQKEVERKSKYVVILEQLSELRVLLDYFDRWRHFRGVKRVAANRTRQVEQLATRTAFALTRRYFSQWASFYDWQQGRFRRHVLSQALEDATRRAQVSLVFHRWQAGLVQRRLVQSRLQSVRVMASASEDVLRAKAYYQWRHVAHRRQHRSTSDVSGSPSDGVSSAQLDLITAKAQRQVLARSMARWQANVARSGGGGGHEVGSSTGRAEPGTVATALQRYTDLMARLREEGTQRGVLQLWRRWVPLRQRRRALTAVATLRAQQADYVLQQDFYYRWLRFAYAGRLRATAKSIEAVQQKLRQAEAEHGDIFEKLQLQKRIDQLIQEQTEEEAVLEARQASLRSLRDTYKSTQRDVDTAAAAATQRSDGTAETDGTQTGLERETSPPAVEPPVGGGLAGMMVKHADYYNNLVDEQRLSPAVLAQMPLPDAIQHVMGQLKANTLNVYTDMALFRQVKDRRRSGTTAAAIFLEAFSEIKRLVLSSSSTLTRASGTAGAAGGGSGSGVRWPLCMEALDCIPMHHCASVLTAIKTIVVSFDLIPAEDAARVVSTSEEIVGNADWILLIARACYLRRRPLLPSNNR